MNDLLPRWCEKPSYVQAAFLLERWKEMAELDAGLQDMQPWKAAFEGDLGWFADLYGHLPEILKGVAASHDGITPEAFEEDAPRFFESARHPRFGVPYHQLTYRPMRELLDLLRACGFKVFVASAGGRDFMRTVSQEIYDVPRQSVIGSSAVLEWSEGRVLRTRALEAAAAGWVVVSMQRDFATVFDLAD
jgi:haloacid dehalogenase-like hydrolase